MAPLKVDCDRCVFGGESIIRLFFFFNDTATTEIYTLSLHDALPISRRHHLRADRGTGPGRLGGDPRSEEHTSELQSRSDLVCRLLLEKKTKKEHPRLRDEITRQHASTRLPRLPE